MGGAIPYAKPPAPQTWVPCRTITCPKCGAPPEALDEVWSSRVLSFDYRTGERAEEGWTTSEGNPTKVIARCACGHCWRLRGVLQITSPCMDPQDPTAATAPPEPRKP